MKPVVTAIAFIFSLYSAHAQISLKDLVKKKPASFTEEEAGKGIREALEQGVLNAVLNLNRTDGFFGSEFYKLLMPPDAKKIEKTARDLGMGAKVDEAILAINRGAEEAAGLAKPIFLEAIREMTLADAIGIVKGDKDAATNYFREKTRVKLVEAFTPSVEQSLEKTNATRYYADIVNTYNRLPTTFKKSNPDLGSYVVEKALDALFDQVAREEANIRANPAARGSELLKKVFGAK